MDAVLEKFETDVRKAFMELTSNIDEREIQNLHDILEYASRLVHVTARVKQFIRENPQPRSHSGGSAISI